jgi:hypothetical protein
MNFDLLDNSKKPVLNTKICNISAKYSALTQPYFYLIFPKQNNLSSHCSKVSF